MTQSSRLNVTMDANSLKGQLINSYLNQQLTAALDDGTDGDNHEDDINGASGGAVRAMELPDNAILEEFKTQVRQWIEVDNQIQKLQQLVRERNVFKKNLSGKILRFMSQYNIEDLHAKDGSRLRYKVAEVKTTPSKAEIRQLIEDNYNKVESVDKLMEIVFAKQTKKVESLRRLRTKSS